MIDYRELSSGDVPGRGLENLARRILEISGCTTTWTGTGPDGGLDLLAIETYSGPISSQKRTWLVSCKDHAVANRNVSEEELGSVVDKVAQHHADGFLLVTTTTLTAGAKAMLDGINSSQQSGVRTRVWDRTELDSFLIQPLYRDLLLQFFPKSLIRVQEAERTRAPLPALHEVPSEVAEQVMEILAPYARWVRVGGSMWPGDPERAEGFDHLCDAIMGPNQVEPEEAAEYVNPSHLDVLALLLRLTKKEPYSQIGTRLARRLLELHPESDCALNCFQFLVDGELSREEQIGLAQYLGEDGLEHLYFDEVAISVQDTIMSNATDYSAWSDLDSLSSNTALEYVHVEQLTFEADGSRVIFTGSGEIECELSYDREAMGNTTVPCSFEGYFDAEGIYLEEVSVDTSGFHDSGND